MPTETTLNSLKVHKVPDFETWEENYNQTNGIGTSDVVVIPPEELKKGVLPDQTNNSGKFLTTDGNGNTSWATVDALPSQSGNSGKYLKTNGSAATWENAPVTSVNSKTGAVSLSASDVNAVATSAVGANSGVAPLNASGKIDSTYLPSYVDDVIEGYYYNSKFYTTSAHTTEITGETGKIFVDLSTNKTYRYGGSSFTEISQGSVVSVSRDLTSGTKIGTLTINGTGTDLYAPTPETFTVTGGASTIVSDNLTANRALISNASGKVAVSDVTSTELGYLDGVTSAIQTQINGKQAKVTASGILKGDGSGGVSAATAGTDYPPVNHASTATTYGVGTSSNYGHVKLSDSTSSTDGTSNGVAATPAAVKAAYDKANNAVPKTVSSNPGTSTISHTWSGFSISITTSVDGNNSFAVNSDSTEIHNVVTPTADGDAVPKSYVDNAISNIDALPSQTNNSGKFLTTNGTSASWATVSIPTVPTMDASPTDGNSSNTVSSNGVYDMVMGRTKIYTGSCSTAAATAAKVVTLDDATGFSKTAGVMVLVRFTYGNSATTPTLNVNSTSASNIAIPSSATAYTTGNGTTYNTWGAYESILFTYTGTYWVHIPSGYLGYLAYNTASGRQAKITASGILKGDGAGTISAAVAGTDYAPVNHATTATTYGVGDSSNYGHVKLSDSTSSTSSTTGGIAATPAAVKAAYDLANGKQASIGTTSGILKGNGSGTISAAIAGTDYQAPLPSQSGNSGKYLTTNGSSVSWETPPLGVYYGECSTAAATQAKTVTITDFPTTLTAGLSVRIKFTNGQTYAGTPTLQVNSTEAKNIYRSSVAGSQYMWYTGEVLDFVYDGTNWVAINEALASTTYYGITKLSSSTSSTSTSLAATPSAVKAAYDLANGKQSSITASGILKGNGSGTVSAAVAGTDYQAPVSASTITTTTTWSGSGPYTQTVTLSGYTATANTKVDIQLTAAQITQLITDGVTSLLVANSNGTLTMYATGAAPTTAMTIQATCTEVTVA